MNKLFRDIKENANLDLLEESDNEEEFENVNIDRFVHLNKEYLIEMKLGIPVTMQPTYCTNFYLLF